MRANQARVPAAPILLLGVLALGLAPGSIAGQDRIQERHELRPDASVQIRGVSHSIQVERWDRSEIEVTGDYDRDREELEVRADPGSFRLNIRSRRERGGWTRQGRGELTVRVPEGIRLELGSVSGSIRVRDIRGPVTAQSVSGSVNVAGSPERVTAESVSGSVTFTGSSQAVQARTVSGSVTLEADSPGLEAQSVSGQIRITSSTPGRSVSLNSVSGAVRFAGPVAPSGTLKAESHSGLVELELSGDLDATFTLSTFSGRIRQEVSGARDEAWTRSRYGPGEEVSFVAGPGTARVEAKTFSGQLRVRGAGR